MSNVYLCVGRYAKSPYYFEKTFVNVYCIEELCYCLVQNAGFLERDIVDKKLVEWIDKQCGLSELADELLPLVKSEGSATAFVEIILEYVGYCSEEELNRIDKILKAGIDLNRYEKKLHRAKYLHKKGMLQNAISILEELSLELPDDEDNLLIQSYELLGGLYANCFSWDKSLEAFLRAYTLSEESKYMDSYLMTAAICYEESAFRVKASEMVNLYGIDKEQCDNAWENVNSVLRDFDATEENRMLSALSFSRDDNKLAYQHEMQNHLGRMKKSYRDSMRIE